LERSAGESEEERFRDISVAELDDVGLCGASGGIGKEEQKNESTRRLTHRHESYGAGHRRMPGMASKDGPWWANTWWGKRTTTINISIAIALLLFMLWKTLFP
jgi:hypothetical protein